MVTPYNSTEAMIENQFASINQYPKHNIQNNKQKGSFKRTKTLKRNTSEPNTTQSHSRSDNNPQKNRGKNRKKNREAQETDTTPSNLSNKQKPCSKARKIYLWCIQCSREKRSKLTEAHKKKANFCKRLRNKCKRHKKKKKKRKTTFSKESTVSLVQQDAILGETSREIQKKDEKYDKTRDPKKSKKTKKMEKSDSTVPVFQTDKGEEVDKGLVPDLGTDFTKSCCYLCAKNTIAIAAAMSKIEKFHVSIQASDKETFTSDKSCSPAIRVRTVQSSVKVKMRDMSTAFPEKKKSKKRKPKLKLKKLNILPKLRTISFATYPKVRTVACETDKSMRHNNIPQCRARHGIHCITEANKM